MPSGLAVLVAEDQRFPFVRIAVVVGTGAADGGPGQDSLAHLTEHLWFRTDLGGSDAASALEAAGCSWNAHTANDWTSFELGCPADAAELALTFATRVAGGALTGLRPDVVEIEKHIVLHEAGDRRDGVIGPLYESVMRAVFAAPHPYARDEDDDARLLALTQADVEGFVRDHYLPGKAAISIGGALAPERVAAFLATHPVPGLVTSSTATLDTREWPARTLWWASASDETVRWYVDPASPEQPLELGRAKGIDFEETVIPPPPGDAVRVSLPATNTTVAVAWPLPAIATANYWRLVNMGRFATVDARHMLKRVPGIHGVSCMVDPGRLASLLMCVVDLRPSGAPEAVAAVLARGFAKPFTLDREIALEAEDNTRVWSDMQSNERERMDIDTIVAMARHRLATGYGEYWGARYAESSSDASVGPYLSIASRWVTPDRAVVVIADPSRDVPESSATAIRVAAADDVATPWPAPSFGIAGAADATEHVLANGLRVVMLPVEGRDVARWSVVMPWRDRTAAEPLVLDGAVATPRRYQGNKIRYASGVQEGAGYTDVNIAQRGSWDPVFVARSLWATVDRMDASARKEVSSAVVDQVMALSADPATWADELIREQATGVDGDAWLRRVRALGSMSDAGVSKILSASFRPERATLVVVGTMHRDTRARIGDELDDWSARRAATADPAPAPGDWRPGVFVFDNAGGGTRTSVRLTVPLAVADPDAPQARATLALLREIAEGRAWSALRATSALTYTPECRVRVRWGQAFLDLAATTEAGDAASLITQMRVVVSNLRDVPPTDAELGDARRGVLSSELEARASTSGLSARVTQLLALGWSRDALVAWPDTVVHTGAPAVTALMQRADAPLTTVIGPVAAVTSTLGDAHLPLEVVDWRARWRTRARTFAPALAHEASAAQ